MFHKIMKNIIADLMKAPLEKGEHQPEGHAAKIEITAGGKPGMEDGMDSLQPKDDDMSSMMESPEDKHMKEMKKLHASKHSF